MDDANTNLARLQGDIDAARRAGDGDTMRILKFLLSKVERIAKAGKERPMTDADLIEAVTKYKKETGETRDAMIKAGRPTDDQDHEIQLVSGYLPQQLTDEELDAEIEKALEGVTRDRKAMGVVMKHLVGGFKGKYEPAKANAMVSAKLS